jgi:CDP-glucose 4,6-dehydratase
VDERFGALESVVINFEFWNGRRVFLTGHTGFKGAWTALVLRALGAEVYGFALPPECDAGLFVAAGVAHEIVHRVGDVRDLASLRTALAAAEPTVVIHLAAQSLVRASYTDPVGTYAINVLGTANLLELVRETRSVRSLVVVTSDKCYENSGGGLSYTEQDPLGGRDPYSSSKAAAELVAAAYRESFFIGSGQVGLATARAGNVIGGGDWATDRLVPDAIQAFRRGERLRIRYPAAVRPWQHVLDPVLGYLLLAERLAEDSSTFAESWNFGPSSASEVPVAEIAERLTQLWGNGAAWEVDQTKHPYETDTVRLDCRKAADKLRWSPVFDLEHSLALTVEWYAAQANGDHVRALTARQIANALHDSVAGGAARPRATRR